MNDEDVLIRDLSEEIEDPYRTDLTSILGALIRIEQRLDDWAPYIERAKQMMDKPSLGMVLGLAKRK